MRTLLSLSLAASVASPIWGCTKTESWQVQEIGPATYTMEVPRGFGSSVSTAQTETFTIVAKAGDYCHAKGQKLSEPKLDGQTLTFRCVSGLPNPQ